MHWRFTLGPWLQKMVIVWRNSKFHIPYNVKHRAGDRGITADNTEKSQTQHIDFNKVLAWPVAMYSCESWTLRKNKETCLDAFQMKGLRKILRVSWTAKKTNEWVLNKSGVKRELLDTVKAKKLAYYGHTMMKWWNKKAAWKRDNARNNARCMHTRKTMHGVDGLSVEKSIRMTQDRDKWRKYVYGVANPRIEDC